MQNKKVGCRTKLSFAIAAWSRAECPFKAAAEVVEILVSAAVGDILYSKLCIMQQFCGDGEANILERFHDRLAAHTLKDSIEIAVIEKECVFDIGSGNLSIIIFGEKLDCLFIIVCSNRHIDRQRIKLAVGIIDTLKFEHQGISIGIESLHVSVALEAMLLEDEFDQLSDIALFAVARLGNGNDIFTKEGSPPPCSPGERACSARKCMMKALV